MTATKQSATDAMAQIDALTAENAAMRRERDALVATLKWTDEVYPARIEAGGAGVEITWNEYNAMREVAGFQPVKRIGDKEGRAGFNHRLRARAQSAEAERDALRKVLERDALAQIVANAIREHHGQPELSKPIGMLPNAKLPYTITGAIRAALAKQDAGK